MGNEDEGKAVAVLHVLQQVQNLSLNTDVESRHWFVTNDHGGVKSECTRDADALALSTRELVRTTISHYCWVKVGGTKKFINLFVDFNFVATIPDAQWLG